MRRLPLRLRAAAATVSVAAAVAITATGCTSSGSSSSAALTPSASSSSTEPPYGSLPTFLPTLTPDTHHVVDASARHPALASQGDQVRVELTEGSVLASVTGPETPGQGLVPQPNATFATWQVHLSGATAPIPLSYREFVAIDQQGRAFHPGPVSDAKPLPKTLQPGQDLRFKLRVLMPTGEGVMRWSPDGGLAPVQWDFEVEVD